MVLNNIPKQIRYDFLLAILGLIIMLYSGYLFLNTPMNQPTDTRIILFMAIGYFVFLFGGLTPLREDFVMEYNLKRLYYEIERDKLKKELEKRHLDYRKIFQMNMRYNKITDSSKQNKQ